MKSYPDLILCEHCDTLHRHPTVVHGEIVRCRCCGHTLYWGTYLDNKAWLAFTITAAITFILANSYPILRIQFNGLNNEATLWQAMMSLAQGNVVPIAIPALLVVIGVPLLQISILLWILFFTAFNRKPPYLVFTLKLFALIKPWAMIEVALVGILVAVIKLSSYMDVIIGVGLWSMGILMLLMTVICNRSFASLWNLIPLDSEISSASKGTHL